MDNSLILILILLLCNCGNNGGSPPQERGALDNFEPVAGGCYDECDLRNMTTPYRHVKTEVFDLEMLLVIMMLFLFKEMNAPISAIPVRERQNPLNENINNDNCCRNN